MYYAGTSTCCSTSARRARRASKRARVSFVPTLRRVMRTGSKTADSQVCRVHAATRRLSARTHGRRAAVACALTARQRRWAPARFQAANSSWKDTARHQNETTSPSPDKPRTTSGDLARFVGGQEARAWRAQRRAFRRWHAAYSRPHSPPGGDCALFTGNEGVL